MRHFRTFKTKAAATVMLLVAATFAQAHGLCRVESRSGPPKTARRRTRWPACTKTARTKYARTSRRRSIITPLALGARNQALARPWPAWHGLKASPTGGTEPPADLPLRAASFAAAVAKRWMSDAVPGNRVEFNSSQAYVVNYVFSVVFRHGRCRLDGRVR